VRRLTAVEGNSLLAALPAAFDGAGPALLPLPSEPGVRGAIVDALQPDHAAAPLERDDIALVVATSGSSGAPKGVMLTAAALLRSAHATHKRLGGAGQWLLALPVDHIAGVQVLVRSLIARTDPIVMPMTGGFSAAAFVAATARLDADRRYTSLVPTQLARLLDVAAIEALRSYDAILLGGSAALPGVVERARANGVNVVVTYGMTETCGGCVYDGVPLDDVTVDIASDGRIVIGGPTIFAGYRGRPDLTAAALLNGRLVTQDMGRFDARGRLEVLGRVDDIVVTGGENVSVLAVEATLSEQSGVVEASVIGVPDDEWGQRIVAFVVAQSVDSSMLREAVRARLGRAAVPRDVIVVDSLPYTGPGKVDRRALLSLIPQR
jgi:o-succinylbenzoate---CoA ligase